MATTTLLLRGLLSITTAGRRVLLLCFLITKVIIAHPQYGKAFPPGHPTARANLRLFWPVFFTYEYGSVASRVLPVVRI